MKAAEAINVLGAAGGDYAKTEAELERRKRVTTLTKDIASGDVEGSNNAANIAKAKAELASLQGQAMKMNAVGSGGLQKIEKLVTEIVRMKKEQQKESKGTNIVTDNSVRKIDSSQAAITQLTPLAQSGTAAAVAAGR